MSICMYVFKSHTHLLRESRPVPVERTGFRWVKVSKENLPW